MSICECAFLFCLAPEDFVVPVRVERRVDVNQIDARIRQFAELIEIIAAIDNARVNECGRFSRRGAHKQIVRDVSTPLNMTKPQ